VSPSLVKRSPRGSRATECRALAAAVGIFARAGPYAVPPLTQRSRHASTCSCGSASGRASPRHAPGWHSRRWSASRASRGAKARPLGQGGTRTGSACEIPTSSDSALHSVAREPRGGALTKEGLHVRRRPAHPSACDVLPSQVSHGKRSSRRHHPRHPHPFRGDGYRHELAHGHRARAARRTRCDPPEPHDRRAGARGGSSRKTRGARRRRRGVSADSDERTAALVPAAST